MSTSSTIYRSTMRNHRSIRQAVRRTSRAIMEEMEARCLLSAALAPDHIVVVIEQDRAANAIGDTANMPYFNELAATGLAYTNAHGVTHPSEPNTLAIYSGSTHDITDNGGLYTFTAPNLADSLNSKLVGGDQYLSFAGYSESLPEDGDMTTQAASDPLDPTSPPDLYRRNVNPMAQFTNVGQQGAVAIANADVNRTFDSFPTTAAGYANLPTVSFVIPNGLHSTHGSNEQEPYATDPSEYDFLRSSADTWLADNLDSYLQWAKANNSLLIVISDEEETDTHPSSTITMIVNGDLDLFVPGVNTSDVNHYDLLRTIEDMYDLTPIGLTDTVAGLDTNGQGQLSTGALAIGSTTTTVASSLPTSAVGQSVTFTATVAGSGPAEPTGVVAFKDGATILGTGTLNASGQATFSTSSLVAGPHSITATYAGDSEYEASASTALTQTVGQGINDSFANRFTLTGNPITTTAANAAATKETGEPNPAGNAGGRSLWWTWTAPSSGAVSIDTIGSSFDTILGVYTGNAVSALTMVAQDDDDGGDMTSQVSFAATAGTAYQIVVDGYGAAPGNITLNVAMAGAGPVSDLFANRTLISGTTITAQGTNVGASKQTGEPNHAGIAGGKSVWWSWIAPASGSVIIDTAGSAFDTVLGIYTGSSVSGLTQVAADNNSGANSTSSAAFTATAGTVYQIAVDGVNGASGAISLHAALTPFVTPPAPVGLSASSGTYSDKVRLAWSSTNGATAYEVWRSDSDNSDAATKISTADVTALTFDDTTATPSIAYWYWVKASNTVGTSSFSSSASGYALLDNNSFASRIVLTGDSVSALGTNVSATKESGEPNHANNVGGKSVWWTWTAPAFGVVTIDTIGSDFDTTLGVYTGTVVSGLTRLASDDDGGGGRASRVSLVVTAGTTYQIAVDGYDADYGDIVLHASLAPVAVPPVPTGVSASAGTYGDRVRISWTASAGAAGYEVWRGTADDSALATKITATNVTGVTYDDTTASTGVNYWYWVKASNAAGASAFSAGSTGYVSPQNDAFAARGVISGVTATAAGTNVGASKEAGEPSHAGNAGGRSVWWSWTAPSFGTVTIDTIGSSFDTLLGVYTGNTVSGLTTIASDDQSGGDKTSLVTFAATAGTTYQIAVDGYGRAAGIISLQVNLATMAVPEIPTGLSATAASFTDTVRLTWTAAAGATGYEVWRNTTNSTASASKITATDLTSTTYDDATAAAGVTYWYWVKGKNLAGASAFGASSAGYVAPVNDGLASSTPLSGTSVTATGTNLGASKEADEPDHGGNAGGKSVWWSWTAPAFGTVTIDTIGSSFDTTLGVYTGDSASALTLVQQDSGTGDASEVSFSVVSGTTYRIAVDGYDGAFGNATLHVNLAVLAAPQAPADISATQGVYSDRVAVTWTASPAASGYQVWRSTTSDSATAMKINSADVTAATFDDTTASAGVNYWYWVTAKNDTGTSDFSDAASGSLALGNDSFAARRVISGAAISVAGTNIGATKEAGEPDHAWDSGGHSVWWTWTAPSYGTVTIDTNGSTFDTTMGVYTGSSVSGLTVVKMDDDSGVNKASKVSFVVTAGTTYQIAVDGYAGAVGNISLQVNLSGVALPQVPAGVIASSGSYSDKVRLTWNAASGASSYQVWRNTTNSSASATQISVTDVIGTTFDDTTAAAGVTYWYWVRAGNAAGSSAFSSSSSGFVSLANDSFANRTLITGSTITATGTNASASKEAGEPGHAGNTGGRSVWWTWTAPASGTVTIDTIGSAFDTVLAVYTGSSVSSLAQVRADDDSAANKTSKVSFAVTAGTVYQIAVDGFNGAFGNIFLHVNLAASAAPVNDSFAGRTVLAGNSVTASGTSAGASKEAGEPSHAGNAGGKSVWWTWTATSSGTVTIDTIGSSFDTTMGVYTGDTASTLSRIASDDDSGGNYTSRVIFTVTAGTVYQIAVDGFDGVYGNILLNLNLA